MCILVYSFKSTDKGVCAWIDQEIVPVAPFIHMYVNGYTKMYMILVQGSLFKVRKRARITNRYNEAPHLTQDTNVKVTTSQLDITNESQEVSPFLAGDLKALVNRRTRKHNKNKTEIT